MKTILSLAASIALVGGASAQQNLIPLPASADLAAVPATSAPVGFATAARATTACDDFNRAALGPDWLPLNGAPFIFSDAYAGSANTHMQHATASVNYDSAVISFDLDDNPQTLIYGAGSFGLGGSDNLYVKIQRNGFSAGLFDTVGFYTGNGSNTSTTTGWGGFFGLVTPIAGGIVTMYIDPNSAGDVLLVDLDENRDGIPEQTLIAPGSILAGFSNGAVFGTGIGLGCYGNGASRCVDDFELNGGCGPVGPAVAVSAGAPGGSMTFDFSGFTPGGTIGVVYGPAGVFVAPSGGCAGLALGLLPINATAPIFVGADAGGNAQVIQNVPGAGAGLSVQAADVIIGACVASNIIVL